MIQREGICFRADKKVSNGVPFRDEKVNGNIKRIRKDFVSVV